MKAFVHIGTEKTGTSAIQTALTSGRADLERNGYRYCYAAGDGSQALAAFCFGERDRVADLRHDLKYDHWVSDQLVKWYFEQEFAVEVKRSHEDCLILSSEHLHSRLTSFAEVESLQHFLKRHFSEIKIVVYLRPQVEVMTSFYSTYIRTGGISPNLDQLPLCEPYLDYRSLLDRWERAFGKENMIVRMYDRAAFPEGSVINDFLQNIGIKGSVDGSLKVNPSLCHASHDVIRLINGHTVEFPEDIRQRIRASACKSVEGHQSSINKTLLREQATAVSRHFADSNEWVRERYFPETSSLFPFNPEDYPEEQSAAQIDECLKARDSVILALLDELREFAKPQPAHCV